MIFTWIEQELLEGEPWSIHPTLIYHPKEDAFDIWEAETHSDCCLGHELMPSDLHLRRKSHHLLDGNPIVR